MDFQETTDEVLLDAAKYDKEDELKEIFQEPDSFDINHRDGLGKTALHHAVLCRSTSVIEHILHHEQCDVDLIDALERATPLHFAVNLEDPEFREYFVGQLLDAGADYRIKDRNGDTAIDLIKPDDDKVRLLFRKHQAEASIDKGDIACDDDDDDGDVTDESD